MRSLSLCAVAVIVLWTVGYDAVVEAACKEGCNRCGGYTWSDDGIDYYMSKDLCETQCDNCFTDASVTFTLSCTTPGQSYVSWRCGLSNGVIAAIVLVILCCCVVGGVAICFFVGFACFKPQQQVVVQQSAPSAGGYPGTPPGGYGPPPPGYGAPPPGYGPPPPGYGPPPPGY